MDELDQVKLNEEISEDDFAEMKISMLQDVNVNKSFKHASSDILLEALINQICKYVEKDIAKQRQLYLTICDKLHELRLLGKTYKLQELQHLREKYMGVLQKLILAAKCYADVDIPTSEENSKANIEPIHQFQSQSRGKLFDWSRYAHEFREMEFIARGGFGQVYKAHNILDNCAYAVKKICLKYHNVDSFVKSLREVQTLAKLNHPNIVAYKAAWLEPFDSRKHTSIAQQMKTRVEVIEELRPQTKIQAIEEPRSELKLLAASNSLDIEFKDSSDSFIKFKNSQSSPNSSHHSIDGVAKDHSQSKSNASSEANSISHKTDSSASTNGLQHLFSENEDREDKFGVFWEHESSQKEEEKDGVIWKYNVSRKESMKMSLQAVGDLKSRNEQQAQFSYFFPESLMVSMDWVTLYIQMQLCEMTLKQWLTARPDYSQVDFDKQVFYIFKQIVQGLEYIHSKGIVHHDIKPSNIFLSHDLRSVQVGDFGLACCLITHSSQDNYSFITPPPRTEHPLGTRLYAAPEQLHGLCDPKSDVYSLGVVLYEMLIHFSTDMEKSKEITKLKMGHMAPHVTSQYPHFAKIITKLLDNNPKHRPSASQILFHLESNLNSTQDLHSNEKDELITQLKKELTQKKEEIIQLQCKLKQLELGNEL